MIKNEILRRKLHISILQYCTMCMFTFSFHLYFRGGGSPGQVTSLLYQSCCINTSLSFTTVFVF